MPRWDVAESVGCGDVLLLRLQVAEMYCGGDSKLLWWTVADAVSCMWCAVAETVSCCC